MELTEKANRLCPLPLRVSRFLSSDFMCTVQSLWWNDSPAFNLCISQVPGLTLSRVQSFKSHPALSSANALCSFWGLVSRVTLAWPSLGMRTWVTTALESPWITHWLSVQRWRRKMPQRGFVLATVAPFLQRAALELCVLFRMRQIYVIFSVSIIKTLPCGWILAWLAVLAPEQLRPGIPRWCKPERILIEIGQHSCVGSGPANWVSCCYQPLLSMSSKTND